MIQEKITSNNIEKKNMNFQTFSQEIRKISRSYMWPQACPFVAVVAIIYMVLVQPSYVPVVLLNPVVRIFFDPVQILELRAGSGRPLADLQSSQFTLMGAGECKSNSV